MLLVLQVERHLYTAILLYNENGKQKVVFGKSEFGDGSESTSGLILVVKCRERSCEVKKCRIFIMSFCDFFCGGGALEI